MKGLLIKDFELLKNNMKNSLILIVLIGVGISAYNTDTTFVITYLAIVGTSFTTSTFSYDEFDNGYAFLLSLPVTRRGYIAEKYIFGLCMSIAGWLTGTIISIIAGMTRHIIMPTDTILAALMLLPVGLLLLAAQIPFHLKFGVDKGRIIIVGVIGLLFLLFVMGAEIVKFINIDLGALWKNLPVLGMGTAIVAFFGIGIALLLLSCRISIGIMERKEF